jgi:hypothetical protein
MNDQKRARQGDQAPAGTAKTGHPMSDGKNAADAKGRAERQAEELRRNLLRRKAQQRQRQTRD